MVNLFTMRYLRINSQFQRCFKIVVDISIYYYYRICNEYHIAVGGIHSATLADFCTI